LYIQTRGYFIPAGNLFFNYRFGFGEQLPFVVCSYLGLCLSFSLSRNISRTSARLLTSGLLINVLAFSVVLIFAYGLLVVWLPITQSISAAGLNCYTGFLYSPDLGMMKTLRCFVDSLPGLFKVDLNRLFIPFSEIGINNLIWPNFNEMTGGRIREENGYGTAGLLAQLSLISVSYFANLLRIGIAVFFIATFLLRPLVMRPLSLVWLRIVESEKPIFTLILGGIAASITIVTQVMRHI
jgi:hypothetical protein